MQYFRFLPDPAKLRKEARWSGASSVPGIGERVQPIKKRGLLIDRIQGYSLTRRQLPCIDPLRGLC